MDYSQINWFVFNQFKFLIFAPNIIYYELDKKPRIVNEEFLVVNESDG